MFKSKEIQEELALYEDLRFLRDAKAAEKDAPTIGMVEFKKKIAGQKKRKHGR